MTAAPLDILSMTFTPIPCARCNKPRELGHRSWCRSCNAAYQREWRKKQKALTEEALFKRSVRDQATCAQRKGLLVKQPCAHCLDEGTEKHHADYSRPLDVVWLCQPCHKRWHRFNEAKCPPRALTMADILARHFSEPMPLEKAA